jgi:hypothetical protein
MNRLFFCALCLIIFSTSTFSQNEETELKENNNYELSINGFRNPSIGLEIKHKSLSLHAGYYLTVVPNDDSKENENTSFVRAGLSHWFDITNSFSAYVSVSYLYGLSKSYEDESAYMLEGGVKFFVWEGLNLRLGVAGLMSPDHKLKINPTPGISYSLFF